jgi:hypothetical protein
MFDSLPIWTTARLFSIRGQEFPQKIEEAWYYKSPFRSRKKIHHYYFVHNPCDVTSIFVDIPSGRNKRTLIYYHQRADLKYEAVYFPYDVNRDECPDPKDGVRGGIIKKVKYFFQTSREYSPYIHMNQTTKIMKKL